MENLRKITDKEIKILKIENRVSYIFCILAFLFTALANLLIYLTIGKINLLTIIIDIAISIIAILLVYIINKPRNKDITNRIKTFELKEVLETRKEVDYEAGSGALYLPVFAKLCSKFWGQSMRSYDKYVLILTSDRTEIHTIDKELFQTIKKGDLVEVYYSKYGNTFLGITSHKE